MKIHTRALIPLLFLLSLAIGCLAAGDGTSRASTPTVSPQLRPDVGQGTNLVTAYKVESVDERGLEHRSFVLFAHDTREVIRALSTNQVCFVKGKFYAVSPGIQSFSIMSSHKVGESELSAEQAVSVATKLPAESEQASAKTISLKQILAIEKSRRLARPLMLRSVQPRVEGGKLIVVFESATGLKGKVALDDQLNAVSTELSAGEQ